MLQRERERDKREERESATERERERERERESAQDRARARARARARVPGNHARQDDDGCAVAQVGLEMLCHPAYIPRQSGWRGRDHVSDNAHNVGVDVAETQASTIAALNVITVGSA